jgi:hypothetical protein
LVTGIVRDQLGSYDVAWYGAGSLCIVAAVMALSIGGRTPRYRPTATPAPAGPALD